MTLIEMASGLGATALVFGSPKNRQRRAIQLPEATEIAAEFFRGVGALAWSRGCVVCIEPNPPAYECDFINTTEEAASFVDTVASRGIKVQGDVGAMLSMKEDPAAAIERANGFIGHFHVSEPALAEISDRETNSVAASALRKARYAGWVSIEMRAAASGSRVEAISRAASLVASAYSG